MQVLRGNTGILIIVKFEILLLLGLIVIVAILAWPARFAIFLAFFFDASLCCQTQGRDSSRRARRQYITKDKICIHTRTYKHEQKYTLAHTHIHIQNEQERERERKRKRAKREETRERVRARAREKVRKGESEGRREMKAQREKRREIEREIERARESV